MAEKANLESRRPQLVAELVARVAPPMVRELVHLVEQEGMAGHGEHEHAPRLQDGPEEAQGSFVVVQVLQDVEQADQALPGSERWGLPLVDQDERRPDASACEGEPLRVGVTGPRHRQAGCLEERQEPAASAAHIEERALPEIVHAGAKPFEDDLAPGYEPEVRVLDEREGAEIVRVVARPARTAPRQVEDAPALGIIGAASVAARPGRCHPKRPAAAGAGQRRPRAANAGQGPGPR